MRTKSAMKVWCRGSESGSNIDFTSSAGDA